MSLRHRHRSSETPEAEVLPCSSTSESDAFWWWPPSCPAANALTANEDEIWNAGRFAPAGIRFAFDAPFRCSRIELLPCMVPAKGAVVHEFRSGGGVYQIRTEATDRRWIRVEFEGGGMEIEKLDIVTLASPSWVAWRRVRFWKHLSD